MGPSVENSRYHLYIATVEVCRKLLGISKYAVVAVLQYQTGVGQAICER